MGYSFVSKNTSPLQNWYSQWHLSGEHKEFLSNLKQKVIAPEKFILYPAVVPVWGIGTPAHKKEH